MAKKRSTKKSIPRKAKTTKKSGSGSHEHTKTKSQPVPPVESGTKQEPKRDSMGRFRPGNSGNPSGRPRARRHLRETLERLLHEPIANNLTAGEAILRSSIRRACMGESEHTRLLLDRLLPRLQPDTPPPDETIVIGTIGSLVEAREALSRLAAAVASGSMSPELGRSLESLIRTAAATLPPESTTLREGMSMVEKRACAAAHRAWLLAGATEINKPTFETVLDGTWNPALTPPTAV